MTNSNKGFAFIEFLLIGLIAVAAIAYIFFLQNPSKDEDQHEHYEEKTEITETSDFSVNDILSASPDVPTNIEVEGGSFELYEYKEDLFIPYCHSKDAPECFMDPIYGDYTYEGYSCDANPFVNSSLPPRASSGDGVIDKYTYETIEIGEYSLIASNHSLAIFLLKDSNERCHPYKFDFALFDKTKVITDQYGASKSYPLLNPPSGTENNFYSLYGRFCGGAQTLLVIDSNYLDNLLVNISDEPTKISVLKPDTSYGEFAMNKNLYPITRSISNKVRQPSFGHASLTDLGETLGSETMENLIRDNGIIFVEVPIFPGRIFAFIEFDYRFQGGC